MSLIFVLSFFGFVLWGRVFVKHCVTFVDMFGRSFEKTGRAQRMLDGTETKKTRKTRKSSKKSRKSRKSRKSSKKKSTKSSCKGLKRKSCLKNSKKCSWRSKSKRAKGYCAQKPKFSRK